MVSTKEDETGTGTSTTYEDMEAVSLIAQAEAGERGAPEGNRNALKTNVNNVNVCLDAKQETSAGNSTTYTMRRLAKDAPELHKAVVSGEQKKSGQVIAAT